MYKIVISFLALSLCLTLRGQNELDAERMSMGGLAGTARVQGMGGAFSAAGGDFSSATLNPAGFALYKRSDFMFTTGLRFTSCNRKPIIAPEWD